jgi:1,4-alpha-glucan branching enzyme
VADLNGAYRRLPALHCNDFDAGGFSWLPCERHETTLLTFLRRGRSEEDMAVVICNMTPEPRQALRVAMPEPGTWHEILNSDAAFYGGSGVGNLGRVTATAHPVGGWPASALVTVPPLGTVILSNRPLTNQIQEVPHARE